MKKIILTITITVFFIVMFKNLSMADTGCKSVNCLCFSSPQMIDFNSSFKHYIALLKGDIRAEMALKALNNARRKWKALSLSVSDADRRTRARITAVDAMLKLAEARLEMGDTEDAKELSVPIRSEIYLIHKENNLITSEDYMIFFHNGLLHRAEPLVEDGCYMELDVLSKRMTTAAGRFRECPVYADTSKYRSQYKNFSKALDAFLSAVRKANNYVDPEFGRERIKRIVSDALHRLHKKFGILYLGFPDVVPRSEQG